MNSKIHLVCDGQGRPVHIHLTAGNVADISPVYQCLANYVRAGSVIIADRGYDANHFRTWIEKRQAIACIPPRRNRKIQYEYDVNIYKTRNIIERLFGRLKDWRQLSLRTFRCPKNFLAAVHIAAVVLWLL